jgi:hypothetical protein
VVEIPWILRGLEKARGFYADFANYHGFFSTRDGKNFAIDRISTQADKARCNLQPSTFNLQLPLGKARSNLELWTLDLGL